MFETVETTLTWEADKKSIGVPLTVASINLAKLFEEDAEKWKNEETMQEKHRIMSAVKRLIFEEYPKTSRIRLSLQCQITYEKEETQQ